MMGYIGQPEYDLTPVWVCYGESPGVKQGRWRWYQIHALDSQVALKGIKEALVRESKGTIRLLTPTSRAND